MTKINSKLLEDFMKENNLTSSQFAQNCNISAYKINQIMSGKCYIKVDTIVKICSYTKIKANDLFYF